jgi:NADH-quinone oxidoreductase subunit L
MFHLFTHAFFKALLFLCAGSVIHAMHHEQDMRFYGALRKKIPVTFWAMMAGTLAITGVGIPGIFGLPQIGFAGFHSKDGILEAAYAAGGGGQIAWWVGTFAALLTSFYSWRLIFMTFFGEARWAGSEHIQHALHDAHGHDHEHSTASDTAQVDVHEPGIDAVPHGTGGYQPHESPLNILIPLIVLAIGAVCAGFAFQQFFISPEAGERFWKGSVWFSEHLMESMETIPLWAKLGPTVAMLIGLYVGWYAYMRNTSVPARTAETFDVLYRFLVNKWYFDNLYDFLFVRPAFAIGRFFWRRGDEKTIDRFGPNGAAWVIVGGTRVTGRLQSGYIYTYAFVMLIGLTAAVTWAMAS